MKKNTFILIVLIGLTIRINAQIPNKDFEQWWTIGSYQIPTDWFTYNLASSGSFYPINRDASLYPAGQADIKRKAKKHKALQTIKLQPNHIVLIDNHIVLIDNHMVLNSIHIV